MVRLFHVAKSYPGAEVLLDVSLAIEPGELVVISGRAGSGKSVLLRLLAGLETPTRGWIAIDGFTLSATSPWANAAHRRRLAVVTQGAALVPEMSALDNVALALTVGGVGVAAARRSAGELLDRLDLLRLATRPVRLLSSGERKWIAVARALVREDARLLIADEPTADLDSADEELLGELLDERRRLGAAIVVTSQEPGLLGVAGQRVLVLHRGRIALDSAAVAEARAS
jgi:ABC-type ATPase involved in cell division